MDGDWDTPHLEALVYELQTHEAAIQTGLRRRSAPLLVAYAADRIRTTFATVSDGASAESSNIASHYDIGNDLYVRMLGPTMCYTCALYDRPGLSLDQAQRAKMALVARKLDLRPGMTVLDIGCGFGSIGYYLAREHGVRVTGVTLSAEQVRYAREHYVHPRLNVLYKNYRDVTGTFDRVYSVGMFEHVGKDNYPLYFNKCRELLNANGIMLVHSIFSKTRAWSHDSFINKYIFPGGELPHWNDITRIQAFDDWHLEDAHTFGVSYAHTLRAWRDNIGDWRGLCPVKYDARFRRMWDLYLQGCAGIFRSRHIYLVQLVFTKSDSSRPDDAHHIRASPLR